MYWYSCMDHMNVIYACLHNILMLEVYKSKYCKAIHTTIWPESSSLTSDVQAAMKEYLLLVLSSILIFGGSQLLVNGINSLHQSTSKHSNVSLVIDSKCTCSSSIRELSLRMEEVVKHVTVLERSVLSINSSLHAISELNNVLFMKIKASKAIVASIHAWRVSIQFFKGFLWSLRAM